MMHQRVETFIALALPALLAAAPVRGEASLAPRFVDPVNGFSLCPPAAADRQRASSPTRLVTWSVRDAKTNAIAWTLTVRREPVSEEKDIQAHAKDLSDRMARAGGYRVDALQPGRLAEKDAIRLRCAHGETSQRWTNEAWVLTDPKQFLVVSVSGPAGMRKELDAAAEAVFPTFRTVDPQAAAAARKESLQRGQEFLASLPAGRVTAAADSQPRWYLYRRKDQDIGFMYVMAAPASRDGAAGVEVQTVARLEAAPGQVMYISRTMFAAPDRKREDWSESARVYRGGKAVKTMGEEGRTREDVIVCKVTEGARVQPREKSMPAATVQHYLPRALALLLPRLVDLSKPAAYAFATYTTAANDFDMRTFTVVGAEKATVGTRTVDAIRATDQVAADSEPASLWVQSDGTLLRMTTGVGIDMELSTRDAVVRRYPDAEAKVKGK